MKTIEHVIWAVALVVCVTVFVFRPQPAPAPIGPPAVAQNGAQTTARTVQGILDAVRSIKEARNGPAAFSNGVPGAAWQWLAAAGRTPTVTVYSAAYKPPSPAPVPTLSPVTHTGQFSGLPVNFEQWHHADTLAANEEALKKTPVDLHIDQVPVQTNRIGAVYVNDGATGVTYAIARHKQFDLDLGVANGNTGIEALAGYGYNLPRTDAGLFVGIGVGKSPGMQHGISYGFKVGAVVHP